jgi:phosphoribosylformylglycinamidine synthase PurS subunit
VNFSATVDVMPKEGVADPQGRTIQAALPALGLEGARDVRVGKRIELQIEAGDATEAEQRVTEMCERLLANPVIETFRVAIL